MTDSPDPAPRTHVPPDRGALAEQLAADSSAGHSADRLSAALSAAERVVEAALAPAWVERATGDLRLALAAAGAAALDGGDPQAVEDALYAAKPDSRLPESVLRRAWLGLVDQLARTGDKPPFGGSGRAESWAFVARSRPAVHVGREPAIARTVDRFGTGTAVVVVRGPGRSAFLAAVRRALLAKHGVDAVVPPVFPGTRDDLSGLLDDVIEAHGGDLVPDGRVPGEHLLGILGRIGDSVPVALLVDDAWLQTRSLLVGAPLLLAPAPDRNVLLVVAGPDDPRSDGPLEEILADARHRGCLVEIRLAEPDADFWSTLIEARLGVDSGIDAGALGAAVAGTPRAADRIAVAQAWLDALADTDVGARADALQAGLDLPAALPVHAGARAVLQSAALEGERFHGLSVGGGHGHDEDWIEDLLFDDEHEIEGEAVGGCLAAVRPGVVWSDLPDGLHPVFEFRDARVVDALRRGLTGPDRQQRARVLRDRLLQAYQGHAWQIADALWRLDHEGGHDRKVDRLLVGAVSPERAEMAFRQLLPALQQKVPYRLALARLYSAAMEAGGLAVAGRAVEVADRAFQAAAAAAQRLERPGAAGEAMARLAEVRLALSLPEPAEKALDVASELLERSGRNRSLSRISMLRAELALLRGQVAEGRRLLEAARDELTDREDVGHAALVQIRLGRLMHEQGESAAALETLGAAVEGADRLGDPRPAAVARLAWSTVATASGDLDGAFQRLQEAADRFGKLGLPLHVFEAGAAAIQRRSGSPAEAEKRLRAVAEVFKKGQAAVEWANTWHEVALCLMDQGRATDAQAALAETEDVRQRARDRFALLRLYEDLSQVSETQGDVMRAFAECAKAYRIAERIGLDARREALSARLDALGPALDGRSDTDAETLRARAASTIDEMEARWRASPAPARPSDDRTVH